MIIVKFLWNPDPVLFSIGPLSIHYYSLMFAIAFILGWYLMKYFYNAEKIPIKYLDPLLFYMILGTIVGARLGEVFFYNWDYFQNNLFEIFLPFKISSDGWEFIGFRGLASHGAALGITTSLFLYNKKYKYASLLWILDRIAITVALGGVFIRIGNFFNSEIIGKYTGGDFGVVFQKIGDSVPRHPVQLYESLGYLVVFIILFNAYKSIYKNYTGFLTGLFFALLFLVRFLAEFVKENQGGFGENIGIFSTGQWLSLPLILVGILLILYSLRKKRQ
jgi:prolipoprotein diacylglyceryl transferase